MKEKQGILGYSALVITFFAYAIALWMGSDYWGNLLSPLCALTASMVILAAMVKVKQYNLMWFSLFGTTFSWFVADALWAWYEMVLGLNPDDIGFFMVLYLLPNLFIAMFIGTYFWIRFKGWQSLQLGLNVAATIIIVFSMTWILFFHREFALLMKWDFYSNILSLYLLLDLFCVSSIFFMYASSPSKRIQRAQWLIILAIIIYSICDIYYTYLILRDEYIPNTLIDGAFMSGLMLIASAVWYEAFNPVLINSLRSEEISLVGNYTKRMLLLLLAPALLIAIRGFVWLDTLFLLSVVVVHHVLSIYVRTAQKNERLLKMEIDLNNQLEDRIMNRTMALMEANRALDNLSKQDDITGLYNRRYFMEALEERMDKAKSEDAVVVLFMDMDRFKSINDSYGHDMGDAVLMEIGARLNRWKPESMLLARTGGDEFALSFTGTESRSTVRAMAEEIIELCSEPVIIHPYRFHISVSVGIAQYPMDALDRNTLMKHADIAMYQAKESISDHLVFFSSNVSEKIKRRHELEILLKKIDYDQEFEVYYQPQIRISDKTLIGAEALLRWKSPELGMVPPGEFIPVAEVSGTIVGIGHWVLKNSMSQIGRWNQQYGQNLLIGVNVSPKQLETINFIQDLEILIRENQMKPEWLDIEITESSTMNSEVRMEEILTVLAGIGVSISIDDFGTGYSSLSYIKRFDIDRLKIARELVSQIETDAADEQIVHAVVLMAKGMGLRTIAEGVETEKQFAKLQELGCEECQGYLTGRPVPAGQFEAEYLAAPILYENEEIE